MSFNFRNFNQRFHFNSVLVHFPPIFASTDTAILNQTDWSIIIVVELASRSCAFTKLICQRNTCRDIIIAATLRTFFAFLIRLSETMFSSGGGKRGKVFPWHKNFDSQKMWKTKEKLKFESSISSGMNNSWVKISWVFYRESSFPSFSHHFALRKHFNKKSISDLAIN